MSGRAQEESGSRAGPASPQASPWEWVAAAVSTLIVGAMIVFLLAEARERDTPAQITLHADSVVATPAGYLLLLRAENGGRRTAAALRIVGELMEDGAIAETGEVTLDFVPGESSAQATLIFRRDPRRYRVVLRPTGYIDP